ncbi:cutinase family protein [Rhodococcus sp. T7]|uniref:cutinase family protein n=1 Tax=Rhodococcus sp. T7 TaxID=627444 RepID=UPI003FA78764
MVSALTLLAFPAGIANAQGDPILCARNGEIAIIGARGSGQSANDFGGLGREVDSAVRAIARSLLAGDPLQVSATAVDYPAESVSVLAGTGAGRYWAGVEQGIQTTISVLSRTASEMDSKGSACGGPRIILVGYSQGAMVMHRVLNRLSTERNHRLLDRIGASVLIADPDKIPFEQGIHMHPWYMGYSGGVSGNFPAFSGGRLAFAGNVRNKVFSVCQLGDIVCAANPATFLPLSIVQLAGVGTHTSAYASNQFGAPQAAAQQVLRAVQGG